jgi:uncharacterized membrane protein
MKYRPKLNIVPTTRDKIIQLASYLFLLATYIMAFWIYSISPEKIPYHFNTHGMPDIMETKKYIFLIPIAATLVFLLLNFLFKKPHKYNYSQELNEDNVEENYRRGILLLRVLNVVILAVAIAFIYEIYVGIQEYNLRTNSINTIEVTK